MAEVATKSTGTVIGALVLGIALGGGAGVALDPVKAEALEDISVAEMVAAKRDSTAKVFEKADAVREAGRVRVYDIKPAEYDKDGVEIAKAETLSVKDVDVPRAVVRPEQTVWTPEMGEGQVGRLVWFVDDKAVVEWVSPVSEAPTAGNKISACIQVRIIEQPR